MHLLTSFNISVLLSTGYLGVLEWENFEQRLIWGEPFSGFLLEVVTYSLGSIFATGGWNAFLSDQRYSKTPIMTHDDIDRMHNVNGVIMSLAFPMMMNGHAFFEPLGWALVGSTGITGLLMSIRGENIWPWFRNKTAHFRSKCNSIVQTGPPKK